MRRGQCRLLQDGNLYGVITGYIPDGDKELGDNLVITTVQDERMIYLFKYWYTPVHAKSARVPRSTSFVATKDEDRFDPKYLERLNSDDDLRWAALQRVQLESCATTLSPEQQCERNFKVLRDARSRML